jgi:transcriptional regulator with XRE-family HTH domain
MAEEQRKPVSPELLAKIMDPQDLKNRRKQVGFTAGELAQISGVPLSVILNIEGGRTPLRRETAEWLHAAIAHEEITLAHPRKPLTPELLAKIKVRRIEDWTTTWFGNNSRQRRNPATVLSAVLGSEDFTELQQSHEQMTRSRPEPAVLGALRRADSELERFAIIAIRCYLHLGRSNSEKSYLLLLGLVRDSLQGILCPLP